MNTKNNKRKQTSIKKIKDSFMKLLDENDLKNITVHQICEIACINRSTFYSTYKDLYDLIEDIKNDYEDIMKRRIEQEDDYTSIFKKIFKDVYNNQLQYKTYLKLFSVQRHISNLLNSVIHYEKYGEEKDYHLIFFRAGFVAILNVWLKEGCTKTPDEMMQILKDEYSGRVEMNIKK